eukprot:10335254-Ditylum_brightwellii.AAC.1
MAAAAGGIEVSSTNAIMAQVQNSTGTYSEGAAAAAEAAILQLVSNLENNMIPTADKKPSVQVSTPVSESDTKPHAATSRPIVRHNMTPDAKFMSVKTQSLKTDIP